MTNNSLREEIIDILKDVYYNNDQLDPFDENDADRIIKLIEKRLDEKMEYYESFYSDDNEYFGTVVIDEIKEMLKK